MIYRLHHDDRFLTFEIPTREVLDKLGRAYPIHINRAPISYKNVWKKPLHIVFRPPEDTTQNIVPDLAEVDGKIFLSLKAYDALKNMIADYGEFLPVTYDNGSGYIFNILSIAENIQGLDEKLSGHDAFGNLEHFGFHEKVMGDIAIFRAAIDSFQGVFCPDKTKNLIENARLTGIKFNMDLASSIGESYGVSH